MNRFMTQCRSCDGRGEVTRGIVGIHLEVPGEDDRFRTLYLRDQIAGLPDEAIVKAVRHAAKDSNRVVCGGCGGVGYHLTPEGFEMWQAWRLFERRAEELKRLYDRDL